jgi:hypothetical protein
VAAPGANKDSRSQTSNASIFDFPTRIRDVEAVALPLVAVEEVVRVLLFLGDFQDLALDGAGSRHDLLVVAVHAEEGDAAVAERRRPGQGVAARGDGLGLEEVVSGAQFVEVHQLPMVGKLGELLDEVLPEEEEADAVFLGADEKPGDLLGMAEADHGVEAGIVLRVPADLVPVPVSGVHSEGVEGLEPLHVKPPQGRAVADDDGRAESGRGGW